MLIRCSNRQLNKTKIFSTFSDLITFTNELNPQIVKFILHFNYFITYHSTKYKIYLFLYKKKNIYI